MTEFFAAWKKVEVKPLFSDAAHWERLHKFFAEYNEMMRRGTSAAPLKTGNVLYDTIVAIDRDLTNCSVHVCERRDVAPEQ